MAAEELPAQDVIDYILAPAISNQDIDLVDNRLVIFCVDISGSMGVTSKVPALLAEWSAMRGTNSEYISRWECMKMAVARQLEYLCVTSPNKKVVLMTFNFEVCIYGDSSQAPVILAGDKLESAEALSACVARTLTNTDFQPVSQTRERLLRQLETLEENGGTALGPALWTAVQIAVRHQTGAEVVVFSDGQPNIGVGSLDQEQHKAAAHFYAHAGQLAKLHKTTISIMGIDPGTEGESGCGLEHLVECTKISGGTINTLNPLELNRQIRQLAQQPVVATDVNLCLRLPPGFCFNGDTASPLVQEYGSVTSQTDLTFHFGLDATLLMDKESYAWPDRLPFQAQITYTRSTDGMRCLRVVSSSRRVTDSRDMAEQHANLAVVALGAVQQTAALADAGEVQQATQRLQAVAKLMSRTAKSDRQQEEYSCFVNESAPLTQQLSQQLARATDSRPQAKSDMTAKVYNKFQKAPKVQFLVRRRRFMPVHEVLMKPLFNNRLEPKNAKRLSAAKATKHWPAHITKYAASSYIGAMLK